MEEQRPDWVLNAGAYTAVDQAEQEPALAEAVNAQAPAAFAAALQQTGGRLLQLSTDFVLTAQGHPYGLEQPAKPWGSMAPARPAVSKPPCSTHKRGCCAPVGCMARRAKTSAARCCGCMPPKPKRESL